MATTAFDASLENGIHKEMIAFTGEWEGTAKTWFEPNVLADESPVEGRIRPILGNRFIMHEYKGSLGGKSFEGITIFGYSISHKKYQSAWVDSFHMGTAIMFSSGNLNDDTLTVTGAYGAGTDDGEQWGWRTEMQLTGLDELRITAFNISPAGEEAIATETIYHRKKTK